jgi:two-component system, NarL family, sensor histidine kinase BarA
MSYRAFKRLLGETSLERKCRFLLGGGIIVLMGLSFWAYARQTEGLAYEQMTTSGRLLISPIIAREHLAADRKVPIDQFQKVFEKDFPEYRYQLLKPDARIPEHRPEGDDVPLVNRFAADPNETEKPVILSDKDVFLYYGAIRAHASCIDCHNALPGTTTPVKPGDLMAVAKITLSTQAIETGANINRALLLSFAILSSILIMTGSYLIIRYVVVKPVKHLKEVSDKILRNEFNVRSEINTGDEFQDLSEAFNSVVRHLLDAEEKQKTLNGELDGRLDDLARANMALYESDKAKGEFLSTVSHELRTPLNGIIGFSDVLLSPTSPLSEKQARWVVNIKSSGQQLLTLINDILDLAKIEAGKMEVRPGQFSVTELCDGLLPNFRLPAEKKHIDLRFQYEPALPVLKQDEGKIRQILNNLLSNAIKFTPEGGKVTLKVARESDRIAFTVVDTGVGIAGDDQERIFQKFRQSGNTLTREHEGTGLGLSIVRELCSLLGGEITLKSELMRGSTFTVKLPLTVPEGGWTRETPSSARLSVPPSRSNGKATGAIGS